jgi:hypothetical protein
VVGTDIKAGQYKTNGPPPENKIGPATVPCTWAHQSLLNTDGIIDGGAAFGPTTIRGAGVRQGAGNPQWLHLDEDWMSRWR